jgi:type IV pilus assembly protein PilQ
MRRGGRLAVATALLALGEIALAAPPHARPAHKAHGAAATPAALLRRIDVHPDGSAAIVLVLDRAVEPESFTLEGPRLVIDLPDAATGLAGQTIEVNDALVQRIRIGRHDPPERKVRVVLDLVHPTPFELQHDGTNVVIALGAAPTAGGTASPAPEPGASAPAPVPSGQATSVPPTPTSVVAATATPSPSPGETPAAATQHTPTPTTPPTPRPTAQLPASTLPAAPPANLPTPSGAAEPAAAESPATTAAPERAEPEGVEPTRGPRISIEFHDADVTTVIDLIASTAGYQVLFAPGVHGRVTVKIVDRPWEDALASVLREKRLTQTRVEDVILISPVGARHRSARP